MYLLSVGTFLWRRRVLTCLAWGSAVLFSAVNCSKHESCLDECNKVYQECGRRAGGDAGAALRCFSERTSCFHGCPGMKSMPVAPEGEERLLADPSRVGVMGE